MKIRYSKQTRYQLQQEAHERKREIIESLIVAAFKYYDPDQISDIGRFNEELSKVPKIGVEAFIASARAEKYDPHARTISSYLR